MICLINCTTLTVLGDYHLFKEDNAQLPDPYTYQEYCYKSVHRQLLKYTFLQGNFPILFILAISFQGHFSVSKFNYADNVFRTQGLPLYVPKPIST